MRITQPLSPCAAAAAVCGAAAAFRTATAACGAPGPASAGRLGSAAASGTPHLPQITHLQFARCAQICSRAREWRCYHRRWRRDHMHPPITPEPNTAHTSFLTGANGPPSLSLCPLSSLDCYVILYHVLYLYHKRCKVPYLHYATFYIYIMIPPNYDTGACLVLSRETRQDKRRQDLRNRRFAL